MKNNLSGFQINNSGNSSFPDFCLSEKDKYSNDKEKIKKVQRYYYSILKRKIDNKELLLDKYYKHAFGEIDNSEYMLGNTDNEYSEDLELLGEAPTESIKLDYFPIIPNIVNLLAEELSRRYINFYPKGIDNESVNELSDTLNEQIKTMLIQKAQEVFESKLDPALKDNPEQYQQAMQEFQSIPKIQSYMKVNFKPEIVKFAETVMERDKLRFNFEDFSKSIFQNNLITGERYVHINNLGDDYRYEEIDPRFFESIKAPRIKDVSESTAAMWTEVLDLHSLIVKYGENLTADNIEEFNKLIVGGELPVEDFFQDTEKWNDTTPMKILNYAQNGLSNSISSRQFLISNMYFLMPRKLGKLTFRSKTENGEFADIVEIVSDDYVPINKPEYNGKMKLENLLQGEHIDWFYTDEVWRSIKIENYSTHTGDLMNFRYDRNTKTADSADEIWIKLEKLEYQGRDIEGIFGTQIPIFGGKSNWKHEEYNKSIVGIAMPYQIYFNFLMNKVKELLITEVMPFYMMNKEWIGGNSLESTWQDDPLFKFIIGAQETGIGLADTTSGNTQALAGFQQPMVVNLDRSNQIRTRWELAQLIKNECFTTLGLSPQYMGQIASYETATGVNTATNQTLLQIQNLYSDHSNLFKRIFQYCIELCQYQIVNKGVNTQLSYITDDMQTAILNVNPDNIPFTKKVGIYVVEGAKSQEMLQSLKQLAMQDNTLGADAYEKALILASNSQSGILNSLKKKSDERTEQQNKQYESQQEIQNAQLQSVKEQQAAQQEFEANQNQLDRETEIIVAQIKSIGYSSEPDSNSNSQFDVVELEKLYQKDRIDSAKLDIERQKNKDNAGSQREQLIMKQQELNSKTQQNRLQYDAKLKDIDNKLKLKEMDLKIAKSNKNKYDK